MIVSRNPTINNMASSDEKPATGKYFELIPEKAGFRNLSRYLISGNIEGKRFVESLRVQEAALERRGYIFLSVFLQKVLQTVSTPLFYAGEIYDFCLNLLLCNGNLFYLILNLIRGNKVEMPVKESAKYLSTLGHLDRRTDLDKNIKPGDKKYLPLLSVMASKLSYENRALIKSVVEDQWKMEFLGPDCDFWNEYQGRYSTQAMIVHDKTNNLIVVAFRGTEPFCADDWSTDVDLSWYKFKPMGQVHAGFMKALGLQKDETWPRKIDEDIEHQFAYYCIKEKLRRMFEQNIDAKFIVTGHSLGGALAVLFPAILGFHNEAKILERLEGIYTFGQPRVGDEKFGKFVDEVLKEYGVKYYRFVYNNDMVCRMPFDSTSLMFKHFGKCVYYNSIYEGKILSEEPYKNYFSLKAFLIRKLDSLWELLRCFVLPVLYGREYDETVASFGLRLSGFLFFPGIPSHGIRDYINSIRLGPADVFDD